MNRHLFMHRICKVLNIHHYYENKYGLKEHNKVPFKLFRHYSIMDVDPKFVKLGFDALKDQYTLCGRYICESPHFDLMKRLDNGEDISECDYIERETKGYLDGRYEILPSNHAAAYQKSKENILSGMYEPSILYNIDNTYYAFDGKHRLALCCLLGIKCKCTVMDLSELQKDLHTRSLYKRLSDKSDYSINNKLLKQIFVGYGDKV